MAHSDSLRSRVSCSHYVVSWCQAELRLISQHIKGRRQTINSLKDVEGGEIRPHRLIALLSALKYVSAKIVEAHHHFHRTLVARDQNLTAFFNELEGLPRASPLE